MEANVQLTFDFGNFCDRSPASKTKFIEAYGWMLESYIEQAQEAFKVMTATVANIPPIEIEPRLRAVMLSGMLCGRMIRLYPDTCRRRRYKRASFILGGIKTFIKKLDANKLPTNAISKENLSLRKLIRRPEEKDYPILWMGFTVHETWKRLTGFHVVYVKDNTVLWELDIEKYLADTAKISDLRKKEKPIEPVEPGLKKSGEEKTAEE